MSAREPREYLIVRNVQSALLAMTLAGGYHYSVQAAAVKLNPDVDVETLVGETAVRPFVLLEVLPDAWVIGGTSKNRAEIKMPVRIHWVNEFTEETDEARQLMYFRGIADVERAIVLDITRGNLAFDTRIVSRALHKDPEGDGAQVWAMVDTIITVMREYGQPDS